MWATYLCFIHATKSLRSDVIAEFEIGEKGARDITWKNQLPLSRRGEIPHVDYQIQQIVTAPFQ